MRDLTDTVAVVTGAASGLGAASARALAQRGARIAALDFNLDGAAALAAEIGGRAYKVDVASAASGEAAFEQLVVDLGRPAILVHCAGIAPGKKILGKGGVMALEEFERGIAVNLTGSFNMLRLAAKHMAENEPDPDGQRGVIIVTASVAAFEGQIGQATYAASKGGVVGLVLPAARELAAHGIRVMGIAPGIFETPMLTNMSEEVQKGLFASVPFPHRLGRPEEYADLVLSIVGNPMLNGTVVRLDGALRMQPR